MKLDAKCLALAAAAAFGLVWLLGGLVMLTLPVAMMGAAGGAMHGGFGTMGWASALGGIAVSAVLVALFAGLTAWLTATLYNRLL